MRVSLTGEGLLRGDQLAAWTHETQKKIDQGVRAGMRRSVPAMKAAMQAEARRAFQIKRANFVSAFGAKVYDARRDIPPMLLAGALKAPWVESHETGATITPKRGRGLLVPLIRIGTKSFRRTVDDLMRAGNAFFVNVRGKVILFAENIGETRSATRRFTSAARRRLGGGRVKEVPIAVLVPRVTLRKRTRIRETARRQLPAVARAIQSSMNL